MPSLGFADGWGCVETMIGLLPFLGVAAALLIMLVVAARRSRGNPIRDEPARLPERALMDQILSQGDEAFIKSLRSAELHRLFVRERRRLALEWLNEMLQEARRLMASHGQAARQSPDLSLWAELRVASEYALFLGVYGTVFGLVWLFGPFRMRGMLGAVGSLAGVFEVLGNRITSSAGAAEHSAAAI